MSILRKIFGKAPCPAAKLEADEKALSDRLSEAEEKHKGAIRELKQSSIHQISEAEHIRETMRGVLHRIEQRKQEG